MKKSALRMFGLFLVVAAVALLVAVPMYVANSLPGELRLTQAEFSRENPITTPLPKLVRQNTNYPAVVGEEGERFIEVKLFGVVPLRKIKVEILPFEEVLVGGQLIGFLANVDGVLVIQDSEVQTLKKGDLIVGLNGKRVNSVSDFAVAKGGDNVKFIRNEKEREVKLQTGEDGSLGLWLKDETSGVGTVTYINPENNNFAALGHRLCDFETGTSVDVRGGTVNKLEILGITKSEGKNIGSYRSAIGNASKKLAQGDITASRFSGVFGCLYSGSELAGGELKLPVASRYNVRPGKASLRATIDSSGPQEFDIEIVKTRMQKNPNTKSMIVRVVDERLLEATGGIVHGMSGSPIVQNGHIVGALTHVMLGESTKGYGIYIDFVMP